MTFRSFVLAFAITMAAGSGLAVAGGFECTFTTGTDFLRNVVRAEVDVATRSAQITFPGQSEVPTRAKVSKETGGQTVLTWTEQVADRTKTYAKLDFRLVHFKKSATGLMRVAAIGFTNQYSARGTCRAF